MRQFNLKMLALLLLVAIFAGCQPTSAEDSPRSEASFTNEAQPKVDGRLLPGTTVFLFSEGGAAVLPIENLEIVDITKEVPLSPIIGSGTQAVVVSDNDDDDGLYRKVRVTAVSRQLGRFSGDVYYSDIFFKDPCSCRR